MPHPQDVAVPRLPLSETLALAIKLGVANVDFEEQAEIDGFLHTFGNACYEAGRAAGRASAEPEGVTEREKTVIGLDYDGTITRDPDMWFAVMKLMQDFGHEVHIVTMRHGVESLMGGSPMERRFLEGANGVHFTGNSATGDRDAKRPHMDAKGIEVHVWIDDNPKAVHMSAREIWGWCTQPGDTMIHSAPEIPTPTASIAPQHCQCPACIGGTMHASDCAVHGRDSGAGIIRGSCDCGAESIAPKAEALPLAPAYAPCAEEPDGRCCGTGECWTCPLAASVTQAPKAEGEAS